MNSERIVNPAVAVFAFLLLATVVFALHSVYVESVEDAKHIKLEKSESRMFELIKVDPPKRFYVDLKDVETGEVTTRLYVSRRCYNWRQTAVVGNNYRVRVETYRDDRNGVQSFEFKDLQDVFCP